MMKRIFLLCFIHGFKGGEDTFGSFPEHLGALVGHSLPNIDVRTAVYPRYETRGDLVDCVARFKEWLTEKVIDLELNNGKSSPRVDPSVRVLLIGHSMGGIIAVDTILGLARESNINDSVSPAIPKKFIFPYIQGILAFDTPYLGIEPAVISHFNPASSIRAQLGGLSTILWGSQTTEPNVPVEKNKKEQVSVMPPVPSPSDSVPTPAWQRWGKIAALAGTSAALAAGGAAAAYFKRESIMQGWSWVGSHLEFIGCLIKGEELQKRLADMANLTQVFGIGFGNLYTRLGRGAINMTGEKRIFCKLPTNEYAAFWHEIVNDIATDETAAHTAMFSPRYNSGYDRMTNVASGLIAEWTKNDWYLNSTAHKKSKSARIRKEL